MRPRTSATLATAAAAASMVLVAGCGGDAPEATTSTATSTTAIRQAAGEDGSPYVPWAIFRGPRLEVGDLPR